MMRPRDFTSTSAVDIFLEIDRGTTGLLLADLHSLVHIPNDNPTTDALDPFLHFYHKSLDDYITREKHSGILYQSREDTEEIIKRQGLPEALCRRTLNAELSRIRESHSKQSLFPDSWPRSQDINDIVAKVPVGDNQNDYDYIQVIVRFVEYDRQVSPVEALKWIVDLFSRASEPVRLSNLYHSIIDRNPINLGQLNEVLHLLVFRPTRFSTALEVDQFLGYPSGTTELLLPGLHSLVHVPIDPITSNVDQYIRLRARCFADFLYAVNQAGLLYRTRESAEVMVESREKLAKSSRSWLSMRFKSK